jgi:hypothetical protein
MKTPGEEWVERKQRINNDAPQTPAVLQGIDLHPDLKVINGLLKRGAITKDEYEVGVRAALYGKQEWIEHHSHLGNLSGELLRQVITDAAGADESHANTWSAVREEEQAVRASTVATLPPARLPVTSHQVVTLSATAPSKPADSSIRLTSEELRVAHVMSADPAKVLASKISRLAEQGVSDADTAQSTRAANQVALTAEERRVAHMMGTNLDDLIIMKSRRLEAAKKGT